MGRQPCCDKLGVKRGPWTSEEDQKLVNFIITHGQCCWRALPKLAGLRRCGKSCRLRWTNYLRPDLKRGLLDEEEERLVIDLHARLGNKWSKIAARMPGRTDNEIKNHWHTHIKKKLIKMGIDPITHKPIHQQHSSSSSTTTTTTHQETPSPSSRSSSEIATNNQELSQEPPLMEPTNLEEDHEDPILMKSLWSESDCNLIEDLSLNFCEISEFGLCSSNSSEDGFGWFLDLQNLGDGEVDFGFGFSNEMININNNQL